MSTATADTMSFPFFIPGHIHGDQAFLNSKEFMDFFRQYIKVTAGVSSEAQGSVEDVNRIVKSLLCCRRDHNSRISSRLDNACHKIQ